MPGIEMNSSSKCWAAPGTLESGVADTEQFDQPSEVQARRQCVEFFSSTMIDCRELMVKATEEPRKVLQ